MKGKFTFCLHLPLSDTCLPFYGRTVRGRNRIARLSVNRASSANCRTPHGKVGDMRRAPPAANFIKY